MTFNNKTIEDLHTLLVSKEISATELTQATLEDIKSRETAINAFVTIAEEQALAQAKAIDEQVGRGLTILNGHGYYTRKEKDVLYVVISKTQVSRAKRIIRNIDENAFLVIHDVRDVYGNGFLLDE